MFVVEFSKLSLGQSYRGKYRYFWRYPNFATTQCSIGRKKPLSQKPARFGRRFDTISIDRHITTAHIHICDGRTDGRIHYDSIQAYRASIASRGNNNNLKHNSHRPQTPPPVLPPGKVV